MIFEICISVVFIAFMLMVLIDHLTCRHKWVAHKEYTGTHTKGGDCVKRLLKCCLCGDEKIVEVS
jgi:hypothetical protein